MDTIYAYDIISGEYVKRMPYYLHGDGQQDTDETPVWLLATQEEAEQACNGDTPEEAVDKMLVKLTEGAADAAREATND